MPPKPSYAYMQEKREAAPTWFDSSRLTPDRTAAYLKKLTRLRDNLVQTESANFSSAISRTVDSFPKINTSQQSVPRKKPSVGFSVDSGPNRHVRMQIEKRGEIERRRRMNLRSPPPMTVGVRQIEDPEKHKKKVPEKEKVEPAYDPFDPRVLEPTDPMEKLFNSERIRLLNAMMAKEKQNPPAELEKKNKGQIIRQRNLLTPRRGNEWFITGRYKKEEKKGHGKSHHKGHKKEHKSKHRKHGKVPNISHPNEDSNRTEDLSDAKSSSIEVASFRSDTVRTDRSSGNIPPSTTPVVWEHNPLPTNAIDSTANFMMAIASTAEANKVEGRSKTFHYDPNNYRPIGTPKSPRASSGTNLGRSETGSRYDDVRRSKAITAILQGNLEENDEFYQSFQSNVIGKRQSFEQTSKSRKSFPNGVHKGTVSFLPDDVINVPSSSTTPLAVESSDSSRRPVSEDNEKLEMVPLPPGTSQTNTEPLFVPAGEAQPLINLRHASPDKRPKEEEVSLKKIFRQNELRQKELNNLFEDIKELNKISDTLKAESQSKVENDD